MPRRAPSTAAVVFALLVVATIAAFAWSQRLKRDPLVLDRVSFAAVPRLHPHALPEGERGRARGCRKAGRVRIKNEHEILTEALHEREMSLGERGARERDGVLKSRLMRENNVYLPLHEAGEFAHTYRVLGRIHAEENFGFVIQLGLGRIQVFCSLISGNLISDLQSTAGKGDNAAGAVAYREH